MSKKIGYKTSSIIALTLAGVGLSAHHADAAEQESNSQETPQNVLDDQVSLNQAENAKATVTNTSQTNIVDTQRYQDPTQIETYDTLSSENQSTPETNTNVENEDSTSLTHTQPNNNVESDTTNLNVLEVEQPEKSNTETPDTHIDTHTEAEVSQEEYDNSEQNIESHSTQIDSKTNQDANTESSDETVVSSEATHDVSNQETKTTPDNDVTYQDVTYQNQTPSFDEQNIQPQSSEQERNSVVSTNQNDQTTSQYSNKQNIDAQTTSNDNAEEQNSSNPDTSTSEAKDTHLSEDTILLNDEEGQMIPVNGSVFRSATAPQPVTYAATTSQPAAYQPQVNSSINNYIRRNNFTVPTYEEDYSYYFPKYGYRNGVGQPEGIIIHDTANDSSTIDGEINYMKNNYNSAFVHGFIDGRRIIETQPTDYLAWGAGPVANNRFIHIELVHVHDYDSFARQMNNMADYAATNLQYYGLQPDSAEYDGRGTVWTHNAVSNWLGGTDHVDPHGYLRAHGYSYDELYDLINEKYQVKMGYASPAYSGSTAQPSTPSQNNDLTVNANNGYLRINSNNNGLYTTVYDQNGRTTNATNQTLKVTKKANLNGQDFYLASDAKTNKLLGWVKSNDTFYQQAQSIKSINQKYQVKPGTVVYNVPWGTKSQVIGTSNKTVNQAFSAQKSQVVGKTNWLYGSVNNLTGWINSANIAPETQSLKVTKDTGIGRINSSNSGLYASVYDQKGKSTTLANQTLSIPKKAKLGDQEFYLVADYATGTNVGWIKTSDVDYRTSQPSTAIDKVYTIPSGTTLYEVPWGTSKQVAGQVSGQGAQTFTASQQRKIGNATYIFGKTRNISGWVNQIRLSTPTASTLITKPVSEIGQVQPSTSGIRASVYDQTAKDATRYNDKTYKVSKRASLNNQDYVLLQNATTPIGWFKASDVKTQSLGKEVRTTGQYTVRSNNNGLYTIPWGTAQQRIDALKNLSNPSFIATKKVNVGDNVYLFGNVNQKTGWIDLKDLSQTSNLKTAVAPTSSLRTATTSSNTTESNHNSDYFVTNSKGYYYDSPEQKKILGTLSNYYETLFSIEKSSIHQGVTWYYGTFKDGTKGWLKASDLRSVLIHHYTAPVTLEEALNRQLVLSAKPQTQRQPGKWVNATREETREAMDTTKLEKDPVQKYQFLKLDQHQGLSAAQLNKLLKGKGILEGQGEAFKTAAAQNNINEIYLVSHALLETGNGTSQLSKGGYVNSKNQVITDSTTKYFNMFGIGAFDQNPLVNGFKTAQDFGWNSVSKAIIGGAQFIKDRYINMGQNTLYRMRWNPQNPATHQYATDISWAKHNALRLKSFYDALSETGKYFNIDVYRK
ncbi:glucosaminidase domain-containing protein [Staphylococcus canis]|uniref:Bifunctional autolysin n=1 Tax=Staphylococcus canis TaxID=2724942 RepID=A0ABS0T9E7_9STAP|nr:GW dipeptide domain-containing protein [Staphylococcus canis]MBI5975383.1 autolysin [Staphylococcus canis]